MNSRCEATPGLRRRPSPRTARPVNRLAVLSAARKVVLVERPLPPCGPRQVRVRLEGCGICGSNVPVWEGRPWFEYPREPGSPGHEGWGTVDEIGSEVTTIERGDRVAVLSQHAFARYDLAEASQVVPLPAALAGRPFPGEVLGCAMNVLRRCDLRAGQDVALVGAGFLGLLLTQLATNLGARVHVLSRRASARAAAVRMGAVETVPLDAPADEIVSHLKCRVEGGAFPRVIEATGLQRPLDIAGMLAAERGRLIIAGYHQDGLRQVNLQQWNWQGLDVINAHERDPAVYAEGILLAAAAVAAGRLDPEPLYTHRFPLQQLGDALEAARTRPDGFLKALVFNDDDGT